MTLSPNSGPSRQPIHSLVPLTLALALGAAVSPASAQRRALEVDDLFAIKRVGNPQVSPDGKWGAYTVGTTSLEDEKSTTRVWMVSTDGDEPLPMTAESYSASNPRWSPDGKYLSFTATRNDTTSQVWALDRRGGEAQQLTEVEQGVGGYEWSPDGTRLVLTIRDPEEEDEEEEEEGKKGNKPKDPWVIDRLQFKRDGRGYLTGDRHTHLFTFDLASKTLTQITAGGWDESQPAWSPAGKHVAFVSNRTEDPDANSNSDVWIVAADNTGQGATLLRLTDYEGGEQRQLTHTNDNLLKSIRLAEVENIHFPSRDGTEIEGWIFTPPGYDSKLRYPTILRIHGGPNGMYGVGFNFEAQFLAANGYVVVTTNPRGSSGYSEEFSMALWQKWGIPDFHDVMAGVDHAVSEGYSDPNRLGVGGVVVRGHPHELRGHQDGPLRGRHHRGQHGAPDRELRARSLPARERTRVGSSLGEPGCVGGAVTVQFHRKGRHSDPRDGRGAGLERPDSELGAALSGSAQERGAHAARGVPGSAPRASGAVLPKRPPREVLELVRQMGKERFKAGDGRRVTGRACMTRR